MGTQDKTADWQDVHNSTTDDLHSLEALQEDVVDTGSPCASSCCGKWWRVIMALLVRCLLLVHAGIAVWLVVSLTSQRLLWALLVTLALLVVEGFYTVVKRGGRESRWICPCFLAYLAAVLPPIWLVELDRLQRFNDALDNTNNLTSLVQVNGLTVPIRLEPEVWVSVIEQALLFLLVLGRWLLPRGDISRRELSQLLFVFMGIASDNMELFELFDETEVRQDLILTYVILAVWSVSLLQFVFVLTATRNPRKIVVIHDQTLAEDDAQRKKKKKRGLCEIIFATEIWSLVFSIAVQDGPYAATRIYTLVKYDLLTYSIIFFICKNLLIICLVFYRLVIICIYKCSSDDKKEEEEEEEKVRGKQVKTGHRSRRLMSNVRSIKVGSALELGPMPLKSLPRDMNSSDI